MLMILILLMLGGLRRWERSGAPWLHLIIRLLRILILLVILHGVRELILGWLFDEAHHVLLCIRGTGHSSITEGRLLLLAQYRLLFLFLGNKVMHCYDRLPRIWLSITRLGVLAFVIIVHWRSAWASEIVILALSAISIIILIIIGGTIIDIGLDIVALLIANGATLSHKAIAILIFNFSYINNFTRIKLPINVLYQKLYGILIFCPWISKANLDNLHRVGRYKIALLIKTASIIFTSYLPI